MASLACVPSLRHLSLTLLLVAVVASGGVARQDPLTDSGPESSTQEVEDTRKVLATLQALEKAIDDLEAEMVEERAELAQASSEEVRTRLQREIDQGTIELEQLRTDFESIAAGIDVHQFDERSTEEFDLTTEVQHLLEPIIEQLKEATEGPRQIERLRTQLTMHQTRRRKAQEAIRQITLVMQGADADVRERLEEALQEWQDRQRQLQNLETVVSRQLDRRLRERSSLLDSAQSVAQSFFATRGLNLLFAIGTILAVYFGLRLLYWLQLRALPILRRRERSFAARLADVFYNLLAGGAALLAGLIVLYSAGDWVLLGLALLFLLGLAWAGKNALLNFFDQIRLLLNLGAVRERERLVLDGVPWLVKRLGLYTKLVNPLLTGGKRRLPMREVLALTSRPLAEGEPWFPCREGEWVRLADGRRGKVLHQTPEMVRLEVLGGSVVTYPTADFLAQAPENLSVDYRLAVTFGVDYRHQAKCTTEIPERMVQRLRANLCEMLEADELRGLKVEFKAAGASSLDYLVIVELKGSTAARYDALARAVQRILVEVCTENDWVIPFTQLTVHQADAAG